MALILKSNQIYEDPYDGQITTAYANVKTSERNINQKMQAFDLDIYSSLTARNDQKRPLESRRVIVSGDNFDTYFSESVLSQAGKSVESQAYVYLLTLVEYSQVWQGDE